MALQPIAHNGQVQRLTTALKNICRDYPAGGTVLRELLQNADDAGATEVQFILDGVTHPADRLIHPKLEQYQGPALLAYNNAVFTDRDFNNLSRLGDSLKINDGSTTGKFGRGFNSVYNWTDSPSIVSRERLLILDPHFEWSDSGGPVYDFVKNAGNIAIKNQMTAFQSVIEHVERQLDGTVIRIPLRTQAHAAKSEISNRETTVAEVSEVLQSFASEFGDSGLLFMRNVEKIKIGLSGNSTEIEVLDREILRSHKSKVNNAVKSALRDPAYSFDHSFEVGIETRSTEELKSSTFIVHHSIQCALMDSVLLDWAKDQKFIPWVAVAAKLPIQPAEQIKGSLFTVLPLPITNGQPVHIHGLFSISPDRARLHQFTDRSTQDQEPAKWNDFLFHGPIPIAWTKLLGYLAHLYPDQPAFEKWPQGAGNSQDPLNNATEKVVEIIKKESLALWPTDVGYLTAKDGLLATGAESDHLREALREAGAPVVYVPQRLQQRAKDLFKDRVLSPQSLCSFAKSKSSQIASWSDQTKCHILEYLLSEPGFTDYDGLELFPFKDGIYRSIGERIAFVHRDGFEKDLFRLEDSRNLDLEKLSETTQHVLKRGCESSTIHPSIRYRSAKFLRDYCMNTMFKNMPEDQDMVVLGEEATAFVLKVWTWISMRAIDILDEDLSCLWLIPLSNGRHRKVKPQSSSSQVYFAPVGEIGELMWKFNGKSSLKPLPLLGIGPTESPPLFVSVLMSRRDALFKLLIEDATSIGLFLQWLHQTSPLVEDEADAEKELISTLVASHIPLQLTSQERTVIVIALNHLKIFQKVSWKMKRSRMFVELLCICKSCLTSHREPILVWTNLSSYSKSIGLLDGISPIPEIDGVQFLIGKWPSSSLQLLQKLELAECLKSAQIIQDHIIPAWESGQASNWTFSCKEQIASFILGQFSTLSLDVQAKIGTLPIVPVTQLNGTKTLRFALAAELIDPSVVELRVLCFDDEEIFPKQSFFREFGIALRGCGLKTAVDEEVVKYRIHCYADAQRPLLDIQERAHRLLNSACRWTSSLDKKEGSDLRSLAWIPVYDLGGILSLKAANECRGNEQRFLVSSQLPVLRIPILPEWEERLGWNSTLPDRILLPQLRYGVQMRDRKIVDTVLKYISGNGLSEPVANELKSISCVLVTNGLFVAPCQASRPSTTHGCERLQPYLADVDRNFWQDHEDLLMKLNIEDRVNPVDLMKVQRILEAKPVLEEADVAVAIEVLNFASEFPRASLVGFKIINEAGEFCPIQDICVDDLGPLKPKQKVNLTHPGIPRMTIKRLGIDSLREQLIKGMLEIEDVTDEDEFDRRENVTTRIADTLDRYRIESTFREYLANADDTKGTSKISWLLDERILPRDKLLTPDMKKFQGPALLAHNDGVFSDDDFKGFKNVGEGSKAHDRGTIGQFGRGSETMYHWTDVPMILSGRYLLILDPQREVLPRNQTIGKRLPGVKLLLAKLRDACPDQLAPFESLWGYTKGLDNYPGTIFRFPLRNDKTKSILKTEKNFLHTKDVCRYMDDYFDEARISLLFLRRVNSIDFKILGNPDSGWSVTRQPPLDEDAKSFSGFVTASFVKNTKSGTRITGKDKWWVAIEDLRPEANRLLDSSRRVMKNVECGFAALTSFKYDPFDSKIVPSKGRIFNTLPLPTSSDLPVHIHATFFLSGDRQSITIDEYGTQSPASEWNRYLLQDALPKLYLSFLNEIGMQVRERVFEFWPQEEPPKRSCTELLCNSFWKKLPKSTKQLFPKAQPKRELSLRRAADLFDISQAVFDFLPPCQSQALAPLLISLDVNLVRSIPTLVAKQLKTIPEVKSVTGSMLRPLFKLDKSREYLLKEVAVKSLIFENLFGLLIPADADLKELDGCHILPLADGDLGTLKFADGQHTQPPEYYVVSATELKLFDFASSNLVASSTGQKLGQVLKSGKFNLARLQLCHVNKLLQMRPVVLTPNSETDRWLTKFWDFWNGSIESSLLSSTVDTFSAKIFRATRNGVDVYSSPVEFGQFPAVVEPSDVVHQRLCARIPDLYRYNTKFMPKSLLSEESFDKDISFCRFVRALRVLASSIGIGIFVNIHLDSADVEVLRGLVLSHVFRDILNRQLKAFPDLSNDLKSILLWPSCHTSSAEPLISAKNAIMAADHRLLVPWMKDHHRFVNHEFSENALNQDCLLKLEVKKLSSEAILKDYVLPLPSTLDDIYWQYFQPLIAAVSGISFIGSAKTLLPILIGSRIAADGKRNLRKACELYDHMDQAFRSAFRNQTETRFLHDSVRGNRSFWLRVGLRYRVDSFINPRDYIQCLQVMAVRLSAENHAADAQLEPDIQIVLFELTAPSSSIQRFATEHWLAISEIKVFPSRRVFNDQSEYGRSLMASIAAEQRLLRLSEVISLDYVAVCWSQTAFARYQPTKEVLNKVPGLGKPKIEMVWRHLLHLKDTAQNLRTYQVREFLADLHLTYEHLQNHLEESRAKFNLRNSTIWLNLNTSDHKIVVLEDLKSSWHGIEQLVLSSSCDAGQIKAVRPGLMRYEKLLRSLGCHSITYPIVARPTLQLGCSQSNSLRQMRDKGELLDITYSTEGRLIQAHRLILAAMSEKCKLQFSGRWKMEQVIKYDEADDPEGFLSHHTMSTMIKYAYEDEIDWKEMEVSDSDDVNAKDVKLNLLLDLHKGADCWLIPSLKSQVEDKILAAGGAFINLENVIEVRERAEQVGAKTVELMCAQFIEQNSDAVEKAHTGRL